MLVKRTTLQQLTAAKAHQCDGFKKMDFPDEMHLTTNQVPTTPGARGNSRITRDTWGISKSHRKDWVVLRCDMSNDWLSAE